MIKKIKEYFKPKKVECVPQHKSISFEHLKVYSNHELMELLKTDNLSLCTGNNIVLIILERHDKLIHKHEKNLHG